jgi:phosphocarrier protein HPr
MPVMALPVINKKGLHARAAAKVVTCAAQFADTEIYVIAVERDGSKELVRVLATSVLGLLMLAAEQGSILHVEALGESADAALDALRSLVADKFGEGE